MEFIIVVMGANVEVEVVDWFNGEEDVAEDQEEDVAAVD